MVDATRGMESQDMNLFRLAQKHGKGIVILVNKWDLVEKDTHSTKQFTAAIHERIAPFVDVPILYISALTKQRVFKAVEIMIEVYESLSTRITTNKLNEFLLPIIEQRPPPAKKGKYIKIKYITQLPSKKVCFAFFCNLPQYVGDGYKRFLENKMREEFDLTGIPVMLFFRKK
jgi:GTP-binding protein